MRRKSYYQFHNFFVTTASFVAIVVFARHFGAIGGLVFGVFAWIELFEPPVYARQSRRTRIAHLTLAVITTIAVSSELTFLPALVIGAVIGRLLWEGYIFSTPRLAHAR